MRLLRVLFAGSPAIAVPSLEAIRGAEGIEIAGVLTNPDTPKGRHGDPSPTEVGEAAEKLGITPVLKPAKLDAGARERVSLLTPDLLVSFAYGSYFGPKFLALFPLGGINIHPSLLPKYRGPTPIQAAIMSRDSETGVTTQRLARETDSGDILAAVSIPLSGRETAASLGGTVSLLAAASLKDTLRGIASGKALGAPQDHGKASYCSLISKADRFIDWNARAAEIEARIRAFDPWPLCGTVHNGKELSLLEADIYPAGQGAGKNPPGTVLGTDKQHGILIQTGEGILAVTRLRYAAKKALFWKDFLNGARDFLGSVLASKGIKV